MRTVFSLTLRQLASRRRLAIIVLLAAVPVGLAVLLNFFLADEEDFTEQFVDTIMGGLMISLILPIVVLTLATAAFGNEVEDRTLNMLVLKPVSRLSIVLPKLLGSITVAAPLIVAATVAVSLIALPDGGVRAAAAAGAALLLGVLVYAAVFTWAGLLTTHALGFGLVYVFLWEGLASSLLPGVRYLSVRGYTLGTLYGLDDVTFRSIGQDAIELPAALIGAGVVALAFFLLTVWRLKRMDVP